MKKKFWFISMLVSLVICIATVYATAPTLTSISRPYSWDSEKGIYYLQNTPLNIRAIYTDGDPTSSNIYWASSYKGHLTASGIALTGTFTPDSSDFYPGVYSGAALYNSPKNIRITATNSSGTSEISKPGYVTAGNLSYYQSIDPNFYYYDELTNYFMGLATHPVGNLYGTYNCLAYALDYYSEWIWPWDTNTPTHTQLVTFMLGQDDGSGTATPRTYGTIYDSYSGNWVAYETKVIYYEGGHFAKVISYNSDGSPKRIASKWGSLELIRSEGYDPFTSSSYGSPTHYFQ